MRIKLDRVKYGLFLMICVFGCGVMTEDMINEKGMF